MFSLVTVDLYSMSSLFWNTQADGDTTGALRAHDDRDCGEQQVVS